MNNEQDHIDDLISRYLAGEARPEEQDQLNAWIASSVENDLYYQKLKQAFDLSGTYYSGKASEAAIDVDQEWNHFVNRVEKKKPTPVRSIAPEKNTSWMRMAAAVLLLIASGFIINHFLFSTRDIQFETADNTLEITLPDGSQVTLNRFSELAYNPDYGKQERRVRIKGEGFFNVERNPQKTFVIEINGATVEVLGTSFNVRGYQTENLEVVVKTGIVKLSAPERTKNIILKAGERGVYEKETKNLIQIANTDLNFLAWKTRKIIFEESNLRSVVETINRIYGSDIRIAAQVSESCVVTVTFEQQSLESILNVLKDTLNLTYSNKDGVIEITHAGC
ncbi:MAG: FecR domain-containing protein [Cyclobacteriaceae bacterium]|nr:FecR domain-containing protein [Cyclobacteriaceae bacterium]